MKILASLAAIIAITAASILPEQATAGGRLDIKKLTEPQLTDYTCVNKCAMKYPLEYCRRVCTY